MELADASTLKDGEETPERTEGGADEQEEFVRAERAAEDAEGEEETTLEQRGADASAAEPDGETGLNEEKEQTQDSAKNAAACGGAGVWGERRRKSGCGGRKGRGYGRGMRGSSMEGAGSEVTGETLYVSNLDPNVKSKLLKEKFQKFGPMGECRIVVNPVSKESRGFAFLKFSSAEAVEQALEEMNGQVIMGQAICVERAKRNRPHNPTPGQYRGPSSASVKYDLNGARAPFLQPPRRERAAISMAHQDFDSSPAEFADGRGLWRGGGGGRAQPGGYGRGSEASWANQQRARRASPSSRDDCGSQRTASPTGGPPRSRSPGRGTARHLRHVAMRGE